VAESTLIQKVAPQLGSRARIPLPSLSLAISERRLLLGVVDSLALNAALLLTLLLHSNPDRWDEWLAQVISHPEWFLLLTLLWLATMSVFEGYYLKVASNAFISAYTAVKAVAVTLLVYPFIPYLSPPLLPSHLAWLLLFAVGFVTAWRIFYASVFVQPVFQRWALVVGAGQAGIALVRALQTEMSSDYQVCGFIDDDPAKQATVVEGLPVLGTSQDLLSIARRERIDEVILAVTHVHTMGEPLFQAVMDCHEQGIRIATMPDVYESVSGRVAVEHLGRRFHLILPVYLSPTQRIYEVLKRFFDVVIAALGLAVFAAFLPFIIVATRLDSRGPVFYAQERVGQGGRIFKLLKLRSMIDGAEQNGQAVWATANDARITRVGRFLRRTRLDEIPQLVNVLKGEMSLIGPRPERPQFVAELSERIPFYRARHAVRPGITGWAQVKYHYGNSVEDALVKLQYDLYYIKRRSIYLDLLIAAKTILVMLSFQGT